MVCAPRFRNPRLRTNLARQRGSAPLQARMGRQGALHRLREIQPEESPLRDRSGQNLWLVQPLLQIASVPSDGARGVAVLPAFGIIRMESNQTAQPQSP